jgi:hypothetical protein
MQRPVAGVQFIELTRKASRGSGIFFTRYNGKDPGKFTAVTRASSSLLEIEPDDAWSQLSDRIHERARGFLRGEFSPKPTRKDPLKECQSCQLSGLCGYRRKLLDEEGPADEGPA